MDNFPLPVSVYHDLLSNIVNASLSTSVSISDLSDGYELELFRSASSTIGYECGRETEREAESCNHCGCWQVRREWRGSDSMPVYIPVPVTSDKAHCHVQAGVNQVLSALLLPTLGSEVQLMLTKNIMSCLSLEKTNFILQRFEEFISCLSQI